MRDFNSPQSALQEMGVTAAGVESLLQGLSAQGDRDSEGVFTIDERVAKRKLAAFQLPSTESWILVLVQAAHRGGATDLKVTQLARRSTIQISGEKPWAWSELQAVLDGESTTNGALLAYAVVVRALSANDQLTGFRVKAPDGTSAHWRDGQFRLEQDRVEDLWLQKKTVFEVGHLGAFPERPSFFFEARRSARADLVALRQALLTHCFASAIPLCIDGFEVPGLHRGDPLPPFHTRVPLALLPVGDYRIPSASFSAAVRATKAELPEQAEISTSSKTLKSNHSAGAMACLSLVKKYEKSFLRAEKRELAPEATASRLLWIQDGVVVGSHGLNIPGNLELTLLLSAAGLKTDLSGLELVRDSELFKRREMVLEKVSQSLTDLAERSQQQQGFFFGTPGSRDSSSTSSPLHSLLERWNFGSQGHSLTDSETKTLERDLALLPPRLLQAVEG